MRARDLNGQRVGLAHVKAWPLLFVFVTLLALQLPLIHAGVGLEYLGPYPLRPQPVSGHSNMLQANAIVGNTGNETAVVTLTLIADQQFFSHFSASFSDNNFSLNPSARKDFTLTLTYDPNTTPSQNFDAVLKIVASPTSTSEMTGGSASVSVPVVISGSTVTSTSSVISTSNCGPGCGGGNRVPEFTEAISVVTTTALVTAALLTRKRRTSEASL
jgi:hypothetical protein